MEENEEDAVAIAGALKFHLSQITMYSIYHISMSSALFNRNDYFSEHQIIFRCSSYVNYHFTKFMPSLFTDIDILHKCNKACQAVELIMHHTSGL